LAGASGVGAGSDTRGGGVPARRRHRPASRRPGSGRTRPEPVDPCAGGGGRPRPPDRGAGLRSPGVRRHPPAHDRGGRRRARRRPRAVQGRIAHPFRVRAPRAHRDAPAPARPRRGGRRLLVRPRGPARSGPPDARPAPRIRAPRAGSARPRDGKRGSPPSRGGGRRSRGRGSRLRRLDGRGPARPRRPPRRARAERGPARQSCRQGLPRLRAVGRASPRRARPAPRRAHARGGAWGRPGKPGPGRRGSPRGPRCGAGERRTDGARARRRRGMSRPRGASPYLPLALAVLCISTGSIFVRMASAPPLAVAFYRIFLASLLLAPFAARSARRSWPALSSRPRALLLASGVALGVHFATWIASLSFTSVAASVLLVNTTPLFTLAFSRAFLGESVAP